MNVNRLRYLVTVVETGSIRRAAELLHLTPAALSKAIGQLERETGTSLLVPHGRGIRPTEGALSLAHHARRVLDEVESLEAHVASGANSRELVRLGTFEIFGTYFLAELAADLGDEIALTVQPLGPGAIERGVLDGSVDVGLTTVPTALDGVEHQRIGQVRMGIFAVPGPLTEQPLDGLPFAVPAGRLSGAAARAATSDGWPADAPMRSVVYRSGTMEGALAIARRGMAACYVPAFVVALHNREVHPRFQLQPLAQLAVGSEPQAVWEVTAAGRPPGRTARAALSAIARLIESLDSPA